MKSRETGSRINDVLEAIENNLDDRKSYDNTYEFEVAAGLVEPIGESNRNESHRGQEDQAGERKASFT